MGSWVAPLWTGDGNTRKLFKVTKPCHREPARHYQKIASKVYYLDHVSCPGYQAGDSESPWKNPDVLSPGDAGICSQPSQPCSKLPSFFIHHWNNEYSLPLGARGGWLFYPHAGRHARIDRSYFSLSKKRLKESAPGKIYGGYHSGFCQPKLPKALTTLLMPPLPLTWSHRHHVIYLISGLSALRT